MKRGQTIKRLVSYSLMASLFLTLSCTTGKVLTSSIVRNGEMEAGIFTAILYSGQDREWLETAAFLDIEGDAYEIVPFGAEFNYSKVSGLSGVEADRMAREYIDSHTSYRTIEFRAIKGPEGRTIAYELRPLQLPFTYGESDVLDINYVLQPDGRVIVFVKLKERIERMMLDGDGEGNKL